ncbi:hypothetical protein N657DRAFT_244219 [Parathielavia appendiculata]|uniref:Uncharacterized protein n=1 Tax=Parathielavia appendiculata TaxID=2587402 RepID=A0AAN6YZJ5_9PEZI|nr:hypothetical protein N657DRAFT_244219 [Parathielavia appendiculata]
MALCLAPATWPAVDSESRTAANERICKRVATGQAGGMMLTAVLKTAGDAQAHDRGSSWYKLLRLPLPSDELRPRAPSRVAVKDKHDRAGSRAELTGIVRGTLKVREHGKDGIYDGTPKELQSLYPPTLPRKSTPFTSRSHCWRPAPLSKQSLNVVYHALIRHFRTSPLMDFPRCPTKMHKGCSGGLAICCAWRSLRRHASCSWRHIPANHWQDLP